MNYRIIIDVPGEPEVEADAPATDISYAVAHALAALGRNGHTRPIAYRVMRDDARITGQEFTDFERIVEQATAEILQGNLHLDQARDWAEDVDVRYSGGPAE